MIDATRFVTRLADALGRYADRVPTDVDPVVLTRAITAPPRTSVSPPRLLGAGRHRWLPILVALAIGGSIAGVAVLGGQILQPRPAVTVTPEPGTPNPTVAASPSQAAASATPLPRPSAFAWTFPSLPGGETLSSVDGLWNVGDRFIGVASQVSNDGIETHPTSFLRSEDGIVWEAVSAPPPGLYIETGVVEDGVLWMVGNVGPPEDPNRGIWTTRDGEAWERVKGVTGLDFGAGFVSDIAHSSAGWLALAYRRLDAESSVPELYRSPDGVRWVKVALPDEGDSPGLRALVSDGERWVIPRNENRESDTQVLGYDIWASTSVDGFTWTRSRVAATERVTGLPAVIQSADATFGPGGFVIVGQQVDGDTPHPVAWRSADGTTWTSARMDGLPGTAGETGLERVAATDRGYVAVGYREEEIPTFWTSPDGLSWTQTEDAPGLGPAYTPTLAASDTRVVVGGQLPGGTAFIWSAPR
jgi:hypothetical protein